MLDLFDLAPLVASKFQIGHYLTQLPELLSELFARFLDEPRDCDSSWELVEFGPLHNRHRHGLDPFPQF